MQFCHIAPTDYLYASCRDSGAHLILAHLVETDSVYARTFSQEDKKLKILDNSAFEMFKQGRDMYPSEKLINMGHAVLADVIVMTDYPAEPSEKTIEKAYELGPLFHDEGFQAFFVPQSDLGDIEGYIRSIDWAATSPYVDYIGISILGAPNAFGVERGNQMQRFVSRFMIMDVLERRGILDKMKQNNKRLHMLGMVDGPNEIRLLKRFAKYIDTWDSSAAYWYGYNKVTFDKSPTGALSGKFELEVDFNVKYSVDLEVMRAISHNVNYINSLVCEFNKQ